jgi:hypothetical protein
VWERERGGVYVRGNEMEMAREETEGERRERGEREGERREKSRKKRVREM